jgi:hypothetical protein
MTYFLFNALAVAGLVAVGYTISPLCVALLSGIGARLFGYQVLPGSVASRWLFVISGFFDVQIVKGIFSAFQRPVSWWAVLVGFLLFAASGSVRGLTVPGKDLTLGTASGILIALIAGFFL